MSQTAAHLVDHVIPRVPVRRWVLSLPMPLRLLLVAQANVGTLTSVMAWHPAKASASIRKTCCELTSL